jgi:CPA1 family monovalent cation:H+ antiporter
LENSINIIHIVLIIIAVLSIGATLLAISSRYGFPFTIALVLVGIGLTNSHEYAPKIIQTIFESEISPNIILFICLPSLIFESAFNLHAKELRNNIKAILFLAIPGLLISTFIIGMITHTLTNISFLYSLLLGSILSATDPVAVISIFKKLGAPKKLTILLEGESLFNDATSIVTSKIILTIAVSSTFTSQHVWTGIEHFFIEFLGGLLVGSSIALLIGWILSKVEHNREIEISLTAILAYGSFIIAQEIFHVSGVTSTVAAGLIFGTWGYTKISPDIITFNKRFWEFLAYFSNALIFLIVGVSVKVYSLFDNIWSILAIILAISLSRLIVIFGLMPIINKLPQQPYIDLRYQSVMYWGGLRGAIALAIILSFDKFEHYDLFTTLILGVVLYTLLVQGLTIEKLVKLFALNKLSASEKFSRLQADFLAKKQAISAIEEMHEMGMLSANVANSTYSKCYDNITKASNKLKKLKSNEFNERDEILYLFKMCFSVERTIFYKMFSKGHFANVTYNRLIYYLDEQSNLIFKANNFAQLTPAIDINKGTSLKIISDFINHLKFLPFLSNYLNARYIALNYKFAWGLYHGAKAILDHISKIKPTNNFSEESLQLVSNYFDKYLVESEKHLLSMSSHFPEFVMHMQSKLAERVLLSAEIKCIEEQAIAGTLPNELAVDLKKNKYAKIVKNREKPEKVIYINTDDHFAKINVFKNIPKDELDYIKKLAQEKIINLKDNIISQNEKSEYIYFLTTGVIDINYMAKESYHHVASLFPGNFFSTNEEELSQYNYTALTPCTAIYFRKKELRDIFNKCPSLESNLKESLKNRKNLFALEKAGKENIFK